jgi:branched-chain amino acid transport system substrate-binding protein
MKRLFVLVAAAMAGAAPAFAADSFITIGMTQSQTGAMSVGSLAQQRGAELWRDEVNAAGGINAGGKSYKVRFVTYDDQSMPSRVQQFYARLINQDKVQFLFGPYSSDLTAPAAAIAQQNGKIFLDAGGSDAQPFAPGNKYLFQVITSADHYLASTVLALASKNPHAKIAMAYSDDPFSKAVMAAAGPVASLVGLQVVMNESYPLSTTDFAPIVGRIVASKADAFLGGGHFPDGAALARGMYDQKADLKWVSILVAPGDQKFGDLGPAAMGVTVPSQWETQVSFKPQFGPKTMDFVNAFQAKYKIAPDYHAAQGYTGGAVLQYAIQQAGSVDTEAVVAALNALDVTTFFGHIKFATDPQRHGLQVAHEMVLAQWQMVDGNLGRQVVWPTAAQSADLLYPIPEAPH